VSPQRVRVLFVCTHNSARSIMAEALLRARGSDRFEAYSAGTETSQVRPLTIRVLDEAGLPTEELRSKSVTDFADQPFDYIVTVCDEAQEVCPTFPGEGERLHWSFQDPSAVVGSEQQRLSVFRTVFAAISEHIDGFVAEVPANT
jgi:arsenate reductase